MATILVPFDGSPASVYALDVACCGAVLNGDEVRAVYVIRVPYQLPICADLPADHARAYEVLEQAHEIAERYEACLVTVVVAAREAGPAIVEAARDCDCVTIGRPARRRWHERFLLDRTLRYVMAHAPCQVLVCYMPSRARASAPARRFVLMRAATRE